MWTKLECGGARWTDARKADDPKPARSRFGLNMPPRLPDAALNESLKTLIAGVKTNVSWQSPIAH